MSDPATAGAKPSAQDSFVTNVLGVNPNNAITGKKSDYAIELRAAAENVVNRSRINATAFMAIVNKACDDFRSYGKGQLAEFKSKLTGEDLLEALVSTAVGQIGGELGKLVKNEIGKKVADKCTDLLKDKLSKATNSKDATIEALTKAMDDFVTSTTDNSLLNLAVTDYLVPKCDEIKVAANNDTRLTPAQEDFIAPFYKSDINIDSALEAFGVPSPASATKIYLKTYQALVLKFETKLYMSQYTAQDWATMSSKTLEAEADAMAWKKAEAATKKREAEMPKPK